MLALLHGDSIRPGSSHVKAQLSCLGGITLLCNIGSDFWKSLMFLYMAGCTFVYRKIMQRDTCNFFDKITNLLSL
jgi:hypothetical protein